MNFVIEALGLTAGGGKAGLLRLLPALAGQGRRHKFVAVLADLEEFRVLERSNLRVILQQKPASLLRRHLHLQQTVPRICADERADVLLCLGNFGPWRPLLPTVVLMHNARYVSGDVVRQTLRERLITWYGRRYLRRLRGDVRLLVQTELMKQRLVEAHGIAPSRIVVIPDSDALPPETGRTAYQRPCYSAVRKGSAFPRDGEQNQAFVVLPEGGSLSAPQGGKPANSSFTFLCLARYYPHKNLEVLVKAMKRLSAHSRRSARCLLTIHPDQHPGAQKLLRKIVSERLEQILVNIGPLDGNEVVEAYRSADALILPSLLESFGRTYLEAMRFDLPILTSDRDFAHEVCAGAALYFDPLDPESVARSMARIMEDTELRDRLAAERRGIPIRSWDEVAARFVDVLERAATEPKSCTLVNQRLSALRQFVDRRS
ncbi:MAG TPA: glycosyltransferase [Terriglobia bacterium]|nr:glycosyltransferase [Terriglobia bacterium]